MERCQNCNKALGQYDYKIKVKDGIICTKCYKKLVFTFSEDDLKLVSHLTLEDVKIILKSKGKITIEEYLKKSNILSKVKKTSKEIADEVALREKEKEKGKIKASRDFEQYLNFNPEIEFNDLIGFNDKQKKFKTRFEIFKYSEIKSVDLIDERANPKKVNNVEETTEVSKSIKVRINLNSTKKEYVDIFTSKQAVRVGNEIYNEGIVLAEKIKNKLIGSKNLVNNR